MIKFLLIISILFFSYSNAIELSNKEKEFLKNHPNIILGGDENFYPMLYKKDNELTGYAIDIINEINKITGANFQVITGKWNEITKKAEEKKIDGLIPSIYHKERAKHFNFSVPIISRDLYLLVKNGNPEHINSYEDLKDKTIVIQKGNLFFEKIVKNFPKGKIIYKDNLNDVFSTLAYGQADATINMSFFKKLENDYGLPYLNFAFKLDQKTKLLTSIRKDWSEAITIFNKGFNAIDEKTKTAISNKWSTKFNIIEKIDRKSSFTNEELEYIQSKKRLKVCADPSWHSFSGFNIEDERKNLTIDFLDTVLKKIGLEKELIYTSSWKKSLEFIKEKKCDIITLINKNEERSKHMNFTSPYLYYPTMMVTKKDTPYIHDLQILDNKKVAILEKHALIKIYKERYKNSELILVKSAKEGIEKVTSGEAFGYIDLIFLLIHSLEKDNDIKINREINLGLSLSMAIRNDDILLYNLIENTLLNIPKIEKNKIFEKLVEITAERRFDTSIIFQVLIVLTAIIVLILYWNFQLKKNVKKALLKNKKQETLINYYAKQDAMKDLVGNITHQWKQPLDELSSILFHIETKQYLNKEITQEEIKDSSSNARRIISYLSKTVSVFSTFYVENKNENDIYLSTLIDQTLFITKGTFDKNRIKVKLEIENTNIEIKGDELQQVILSIFSNIKNIVIERKITKPLITIRIYQRNKKHVLQIEDNCGGIENIESIFELGETSTKNGRGLGLYISKRIVEDKYKGNIFAMNINKGAIFNITLPLS